MTAGIIAAQRNQPAPGYTYRDQPYVDRSKLLPAGCRFQLTQGRDRGTWYGSNCLRQSFPWAGRLPSRCEALVDTRRRQRDERAYSAQCLAGYGYQAGYVRSGSGW
ncbi:MAG: hypothetical protein KDK10_12995 [Maritimibacter sp.]|nr:hypothetical protein [Maritimibacter sp.]